MNAASDPRDWPEALRINCASIALAGALYQAQCDAYGVPVGSARDLSELPASQRREYIDAASGLLKLLRPATRSEAIRGVPPQLVSMVARRALRVVPQP